jgi:hypothetical protein
MTYPGPDPLPRRGYLARPPPQMCEPSWNLGSLGPKVKTMRLLIYGWRGKNSGLVCGKYTVFVQNRNVRSAMFILNNIRIVYCRGNKARTETMSRYSASLHWGKYAMEESVHFRHCDIAPRPESEERERVPVQAIFVSLFLKTGEEHHRTQFRVGYHE